VRSLAALLFDHVWQATLFALAAALWLQCARNASARLRHVVCVAVALKFLVPSTLVFMMVAEVGRAIRPSSAAALGPGALALLAVPSAAWRDDAPPSLAWLLVLSWIAGAAAVTLSLRRRHRELEASLAALAPVSDARVHRILLEAALRLGTVPPLRVVDAPDGLVAVHGTVRPTLLLSTSLADALTDDELRGVLLHELSHVRRRDNLWTLVQSAACCLFWFHPLAWRVSRAALRAREEACDDIVLATTDSPRAYATGLLKLLRFGFEPAGPLAAAGSAGIGARVRRILNPGHAPRMWPYVSAAVMAVLLVGLVALSSPCLRVP
jgi:beta-lactamase regulating signal transducer with metallopeptidase domain